MMIKRCLLGPVSNLLLQASVLLPNLHHLLLDFLINSGNTEEECRFSLHQCFEKSSLQGHLVSEVHGAPTPHSQVDVYECSCHVGEGKVGHYLFRVKTPVIYFMRSLASPGDVILGQHHTLGVPGSA